MERNEKEAVASNKLRALWAQKRNGMSQEEAARRLGMKQSQFNHYLHGRRPLNLSVTLKFAQLLNVHPEEIREDVDDLRKMTFGSINLPAFHQAAELVRETLKEREAEVPEETERNLIAHVYNRIAQRQTVDKEVVNLMLDHELLSIS